jgi:hypothetical protein
MYETGDGIVPDQDLAVQWYRQAADHGVVRAMTELGVHLRQGNGVAWNEAEAIESFVKAAAQGDVQAMTAAGLGLKDGLGGGSQDYAGAARYFAQAAQRGDGFAALAVGAISAMTSNDANSSSAPDTSQPSTAPIVSNESRDGALERMADGCVWSMDTSGMNGSCHHEQPYAAPGEWNRGPYRLDATPLEFSNQIPDRIPYATREFPKTNSPAIRPTTVHPIRKLCAKTTARRLHDPHRKIRSPDHRNTVLRVILDSSLRTERPFTIRCPSQWNHHRNRPLP